MAAASSAAAAEGGGGGDGCQCGSSAWTQGVLGLQVCSECGTVRSFESGRLHGIGSWRDAAAQRRPLLRVEPTQQQRRYSLQLLRDGGRRAAQLQRCKEAIVLFSEAVRVQETVQDPALQLLIRHAARTNCGIPRKSSRMKKVVTACVFVASAHQGLGLTMDESAARAGLPLRVLKRMVWKLCKASGVRMHRTRQNVDALVHRIADHVQMKDQRGAVCAAAGYIYDIANRGWIVTGRVWANVVSAAFVLAARAYHFVVAVEDVSRWLFLMPSTVETRLREIKAIVVDLLQPLPWGDVVVPGNVHLYVLFVVEYFDVLVPAVAEIRKRQLDAAEADGTAPRRKRPVIGGAAGGPGRTASAAAT